ncbi:PEP-CTERM sorting domain-containing protein [Massilia sp. X63]|uniref:PEP-CTERM sorting domain-containing protein n=1 Tax=Massilia sp. X63 TaxID=3237285 RepID=UPI0034DD74A7
MHYPVGSILLSPFMDRSYPSVRRLASRASLHKRLVAMGVIALVAGAALWSAPWEPERLAAALPAVAPQPVFAVADGQPGKLRRIYPYSVVPGGVSGKAELTRVIRSDRVVAMHYASFDVDQAHPVVVEKPRAVHVSYRKGGKVYWTARKVMLAEGETLLSDGRSEMRARCANRISDVAQYPIEAHQPTMEELDNPVEVDEGERYALGPDGVPVALVSADGIPRHTGQAGATNRGTIFAVPGGTRADTTLANGSYAAPLEAAGLSAITGLSGAAGSVGSVGSRPRPGATPVGPPGPAPAPDAPPGTGSSAGAAGAPPPSGDATTPGSPSSPSLPSLPGSPGVPGGTPQPDGSGTPSLPAMPPAPLPGAEPPAGPAPAPEPVPELPGFTPNPLPGGEQSGGGGAEQPVPVPLPGPGLLPVPAPDPAPFLPKPDLNPTPPPGTTEAPAPETAQVPEPGGAWLFGIAMAALAVLRRRGARPRRAA